MQAISDSGYSIQVTAAQGRWTWFLMDIDARVAAKGETDSKESAWRTGMFAAGAISGLKRAAARRI